MKNFKELVDRARGLDKLKLALVRAEDLVVLRAIKTANDLGLIFPILIGRGEELERLLAQVDLKEYEIVEARDDQEASRIGASLVGSGQAQILMKGLVNTSSFMHQVFKREHGLRTGETIFLLSIYSLPGYHKLIYCADTAINPLPSLEEKASILNSLTLTLKSFGVRQPKIAILTGNELVSEKNPSTLDAARLVELVAEKKIEESLVEGPISFDVAFNPEAARHKNIASRISGDIDGLIFPNLDAGNILVKSWTYFNQASWAGLVLGARNPIIVTSRADKEEVKFYSIVLAALVYNS